LKQLKKKLLFSLVLLLIIYIIIIISNKIYITKYKNENKIIEGYINDFQLKGNYLKIEVIGKEKVICNYYIKEYQEYLNIKKSLKFGLKIRLVGEFLKPNVNTNFNLFNYKNYLLSKKIYWTFNIKKIHFLKDKISLKYKIKNYIFNKCNINKYLKLIILGKNDLDYNINDEFRNIGISHLFAVSGMHITIITTCLYFFLKKIINDKKIIIIMILFLFLFLFITNFAASVIRAALFYIILSVKKIYNIKISNIKLLLFLTLLLLLYNPFYVYDYGFLFSFTLSGVLIKFNHLINRHNNYLVKLLITSTISFISSVPIIIMGFNQINLLSILINCFFVPFFTFVIFPLSIITLVFPFFLNFFVIVVNIMEHIVSFFNKITLFILYLKAVPFYILSIYIVITYFVVKNFSLKSILIIFIILIFHSKINYFNKYPIITILDVGQGDSILIELPNNKGNILIDTGGKLKYKMDKWKQREVNSLATSTIIPYLKSRGINRINYLILTHGDEDHMGESVSLINNFKVEKIILNCGDQNNLENELIKELNKKNIKHYSCINELIVEKYEFKFLNNVKYNNENDNSIVIYTKINAFEFLFMGDAGIKVEKEILNKYEISNIDFLKVGHHGSYTSSSKDFINTIKPKYSLISVGINNRFGHPKESVLDILNNSKIYRTDKDGSIEIKLNKNGYKIRTCSP